MAAATGEEESMARDAPQLQSVPEEEGGETPRRLTSKIIWSTVRHSQNNSSPAAVAKAQ